MLGWSLHDQFVVLRLPVMSKQMGIKYAVDPPVQSSPLAEAWLDLHWGAIERAVELASQVLDWEPILPAVAAAATNMLARFAYAIGTPLPKYAVPHVSSDGEGGITFEWWKGARSLVIFVRADGSSGALLAWGPDIEQDMESIEEPTDAQIANYWRRLNQD